jgi:hypothetical protein
VAWEGFSAPYQGFSPFLCSLNLETVDMANPIEDDPELARAVGLLAGRWGLVEFYVEYIFTLLAGTDDRKATILFSFFKGVGTQCEIVRQMLNETPGVSDDARALIIKILNRYSELAPDRNAVLHYPFGWDTQGGERTIYKSARQKKGPELRLKKPTSAAAIMVIADRVDQLTEEIGYLLTIRFWKPTFLQSLSTQPEEQAADTSPGRLGLEQSPK